MSRYLLFLVLASSLFSCSGSKIWQLSVLNMSDQPVKLKTERAGSSEIAAKRPYEGFNLRPGETLKVKQGDKVLEEHKVGEPPLDFDPEKDGKMLLIVGGPANVVVADYTDFYHLKGTPKNPNPQIRLIADLRGKKNVLLSRGDHLNWPHQKLAQKQWDGGGFKNPRYLRVVPVTEELPEDKLMDYLKYELSAKASEDIPATPTPTPAAK